jgi:hypothetical protein
LARSGGVRVAVLVAALGWIPTAALSSDPCGHSLGPWDWRECQRSLLDPARVPVVPRTATAARGTDTRDPITKEADAEAIKRRRDEFYPLEGQSFRACREQGRRNCPGY